LLPALALKERRGSFDLLLTLKTQGILL